MKELLYKRKWVNNRPFTLLEEVTVDPVKQIEVTRYYARVILGLAWPSDKPGALVAVGEELVNAPAKPGLYVLDIRESADANELLLAAVEMQATVKWSEAFCNRHNMPWMHFVQQFNHDRFDRREKEIHLRHAMFLEPDGLIAHHLQMVKLLLTNADKRLYLGEHQRIAAALSNISTPEMYALYDYDEPLLAALGFAVSFLAAQPFTTEPPERSKKAHDPWAALNDGYDPTGPEDKWMQADPFRGL